jgi:hypothetical protein
MQAELGYYPESVDNVTTAEQRLRSRFETTTAERALLLLLLRSALLGHARARNACEDTRVHLIHLGRLIAQVEKITGENYGANRKNGSAFVRALYDLQSVIRRQSR